MDNREELVEMYKVLAERIVEQNAEIQQLQERLKMCRVLRNSMSAEVDRQAQMLAIAGTKIKRLEDALMAIQTTIRRASDPGGNRRYWQMGARSVREIDDIAREALGADR